MEQLARLIRYYILVSTTKSGSGHPTSSLSATDLMTVLMFGGFFRFDLKNPDYPNNDRLIFSKGHASPLFYSLYTAAGAISKKELTTLRKFGSPLEGHPTMAFPYTEAATGSLGQGLSIGVGLAINAKYVDKLPYRTYVLLGDSELAEGSVWEALQLAVHYKLDNLIGILDVNRLGQRGETMYGHDVNAYQERVAPFGWETIVIDGHDYREISDAYEKTFQIKDRPTMVIAKTVKGKGVSFLENEDGWHGKALSAEQLTQALAEIGAVDKTIRGEIAKPKQFVSAKVNKRVTNKELKTIQLTNYHTNDQVATRKAYGNAITRIFPNYPNIVVLDAEVSNSTYAEIFKMAYPSRFFEMYIAEQNMVGAALGLSRRGKIPFVSTFAAFFTRAFDQIRMSQYSDANIKFVGSHAGVSIGQDGASQMGLEDIAMFRTVFNSVVLYPCDAISTERLVEESAKHQGIVYIRTTRAETPILYEPDEKFSIGGSKVLKKSLKDIITVITGGITVYEALAAYSDLANRHISIRVIDLYSIKPIDEQTLTKAANETKAIITIEDHFAQGGLGEAVTSALSKSPTPVYQLAVRKMPRSGQPQQLLDYEEISKNAIIKKVEELI